MRKLCRLGWMVTLAAGVSCSGPDDGSVGQSQAPLETGLDVCELEQLPVGLDVCRQGQPLALEAGKSGFELQSAAGRLCVRVRGGEVSKATLDGKPIPVTDPKDVIFEGRTEIGDGAHVIGLFDGKGQPVSPQSAEVLYLPSVTTAEKTARTELAKLDQAACLEHKKQKPAIDDETMRTLGLDIGRVARVPGPYGTPSRLWPLPADATTPDGWLEKHAAVLGVSLDGLKSTGSQKLSDGSKVFYYRQRVAQVPVFPGRLSLTMQDDRPWSFTSSAIPSWRLPADVKPAVDVKQARAAAQAVVGAGSKVTGTELQVFDRGAILGHGEPVLSWGVGLRSANGEGVRVWIDARTTALVHRMAVEDHETWVAHATVRAVDSEICTSTSPPQSEITASTLIYDTTVTPPLADCPGNRHCATPAEAVDATYSMLTFAGRAGWSGLGAPAFTDPLGLESAPAIGINAPWNMFTESTSPSGAYWDRSDLVGNFTWYGSSRDVVSHEFGHGLHQAVRLNQPMLTATQRGLGEMYGDTEALLTQASLGGTALTGKMIDTYGHVVRDYTADGCDGYGPGSTCDANTQTITGACGVDTFLAGCREYTHMNWFPDEDMEGVEAKTRVRPHLLTCALARPYATLVDPSLDPVVFHFRRGAPVHNLAWRPLSKMWLYQMEHGASDSNLRLIESSYRMAVAHLATLCGRGASYCRPDVDEARVAMEAFYANGSFSGMQSLGGRAPAGDYSGASTGLSAVVVHDPAGPQVWLTYGAGSPPTLRLARLADPLGSGPVSPTVPLRVNGLDVQIEEDPALAFDNDPAQGVVWLAYHERGSHALRVARYNLTGSFARDSRFSANIDGSPAIYAHGGKVWVAYRNRGTGLIETLAADEGAAATRQTAPNSVIQEHDPSFYDAGYPDNPFLLTLAGPTRVCDPLVPSSCEDGAHGHIVRVWTGTQLSPPDAARRLALPLGFGSSSADQEPSTGQFLMSYLGGVGSAATRFINRVFFFTPSRTVGEFSEALAATWSYSPTGDEPWGRNVGLAVAGPRRLAPIVFPDPARGEALLLFSANGDVRMSYRWSM